MSFCAVAQLDVAVRKPHREVAGVEPAAPERGLGRLESAKYPTSGCCRASRPRPWWSRRAARRSAVVDGLKYLTSDGTTLWGLTGSALHRYDPVAPAWEKVADVAEGGEEVEALTVVDGVPLVVFPSQVRSPTEGRTFEVPELDGRGPAIGLRVLALGRATGPRLWIGTGYGEWGGHLVVLDRRTGEWAQFHDPLHYVTGITQRRPGGVDRELVHGPFRRRDADPRSPSRRRDPGRISRTGVEILSTYRIQSARWNLVWNRDRCPRLDPEGRPVELAGLKGPLYEREAMAIGVAPGILALILSGRGR